MDAAQEPAWMYLRRVCVLLALPHWLDVRPTSSTIFISLALSAWHYQPGTTVLSPGLVNLLGVAVAVAVG